jgi:hypothetical protein
MFMSNQMPLLPELDLDAYDPHFFHVLEAVSF